MLRLIYMVNVMDGTKRKRKSVCVQLKRKDMDLNFELRR